MNKKSQLQFVYRCKALLEAGVPLSDTLELVSGLVRVPKHKKIIIGIKDRVQRGMSFSKSLKESKGTFSPMLVGMVAQGEQSGILATSMGDALAIMEKGDDMKKKIVGALVYPAFIACATAGMTLFLLMYIFPKIMPLFSSMDIKLPLLTRIIRQIYELTLAYGLAAGLSSVVLTALFTALYRWKRSTKMRRTVQGVVLRIPGVGAIFQKYIMSIRCRTIGTLLNCGQSLPLVLRQVSRTTSSEVYVTIWLSLASDIERGGTLSSSMKQFPSYIPHLVPDMVGIGEETGSLGSMLIHTSNIFEQELDTFIKQFASSIEPILMITMGLVVGSVALSIILPIYEITNHLTK